MRVLEVFLVFLRLGLTSFGGPVAHLGFFRAELVGRRAWLSEEAYADVVALAQFLPGPASSQTGLAVGLLRAGGWGALAAWLGFTLPSAALMFTFALGAAHVGGGAGWLSGVKVAAVAVVAQAVAGLWGALVTGRVQAALALGVAALLTVVPGPAWQVGALLVCALVGWRALPVGGGAGGPGHLTDVGLSRRVGAALLALCGAGAVLLPALASLGPGWALLDASFRAGALVFGGGHVVLPLLEAGFVPRFVSHEVFVAGYGAANAVPGPLFTFATFLGAAQRAVSPLAGAALATLGVFLPGALLMVGALPFWSAFSAVPAARAALAGVNAGVVGLLLAALYSPVFTGGVRGPRDLAVALLAYAALTAGRCPAWAVVLGAALLGQLIL